MHASASCCACIYVLYIDVRVPVFIAMHIVVLFTIDGHRSGIVVKQLVQFTWMVVSTSRMIKAFIICSLTSNAHVIIGETSHYRLIINIWFIACTIGHSVAHSFVYSTISSFDKVVSFSSMIVLFHIIIVCRCVPI